jgi:hypothetical protein
MIYNIILKSKMEKYELTQIPMISKLNLTSLPNNYILNGFIHELTKTNDDKDMYLLILNHQGHYKNDLTYLTEIASSSIKFIRENTINFKNIINHYYKYNNDLCKLNILECNNDTIKYQLVLKLN